MNRAHIDDATAQFLQASAADLQRQLGIAGGVEVVWLDEAPDGIVLRARIGLAERSIDVEGRGETLVAAHADLCRRGVAQLVLSATFRDLIESQLRRDP